MNVDWNKKREREREREIEREKIYDSKMVLQSEKMDTQRL